MCWSCQWKRLASIASWWLYEGLSHRQSSYWIRNTMGWCIPSVVTCDNGHSLARVLWFISFRSSLRAFLTVAWFHCSHGRSSNFEKLQKDKSTCRTQFRCKVRPADTWLTIKTKLKMMLPWWMGWSDSTAPYCTFLLNIIFKLHVNPSNAEHLYSPQPQSLCFLCLFKLKTVIQTLSMERAKALPLLWIQT